jgi:hypothetical protein
MILSKVIQRIPKPKCDPTEALEKQSGQSLIILAFAFLGLIAMLGLALDLGLVYIERVRIKRSVDAATLAGVVELPYEQQSFDRAIEYLALNGYDSNDPNVYIFVAGCVRDVRDRYTDGASCILRNQADGDTDQVCRADIANPYLYNKPVTDPVTRPDELPDDATWFLLDTTTYKGETVPDCLGSEDPLEDPPVLGTANKLEITGTVSVNMNFMQFFGFGAVDVSDNALAENVSSLDVGVVFDISGSMGYDPVCRGCWYKTNTNLNDIPPAGGSYPYYYTYPKNGAYRTIVSTTVASTLCTVDPPQSILQAGRRYQIIEAELYSRNTSIIDTRFREAGKGYWVLQRNGSGAARFNNDSSEPGTYISQHPERTFYPTSPFVKSYGRFYTQVDAESGAAPRVEYQFSFNSAESWGSQAQVWIRARRGDQGLDNNLNTNNGTIYWALDRGGSRLVWPPQTNTYVEGRSGWQMVHLTTIDSIQYGPVYTLKLYAGSSGYDIDRIFITNNSSVPSTVQTNRSATPGSARGQACDICNPIFGETVTEDMCAGFYPVYTTTNSLSNPIWADEHQPIRTSKEAIKNFVNRLDPAFDQVGFISYTDRNSSETKIAAELSCLQASRRQGVDCYEGTNPISYTYVLREIERVEPQNMTCTACGMRLGLQALGFNTDDDPNFDNTCDGSSGSHCGRGGGAKKVLILITDGVPNHTPIGVTCDPLTVGGVTYNNHYNNSNYDCVLNYAEMAANKGITLYTIGLGFGVDGEFLTQAAELGNGQYYPAGSPNDLDLIFEEILTNIYVRIIR